MNAIYFHPHLLDVHLHADVIENVCLYTADIFQPERIPEGERQKPKRPVPKIYNDLSWLTTGGAARALA
ncbi:hypothetical protein N3K66_007894 [Trichothecium roseum]|uniref:Uncharacterized protein n=1 Tax=Trichothecium roseum TaxID=47278 RepID=A0ACC0USF2_9HYPO|nr:hypothetical protein N3K66_007894 [Trichothecium roseum]